MGTPTETRTSVEGNLDFGGFRAFNPGAPTVNVDIMRLQDVAVGAGILKSSAANGTVSIAVAGTDYQLPMSAADATITFPTANTIKVGTLSNKLIVQGTADTQLSGAQFLGAIATGLLKNTTVTGVLSAAVAGTDYQAPMSQGTGIRIASNVIYSTLAEGKSGGQSAIGGNAASEVLTLTSTSHVTKGKIQHGNSSGLVYDETTNVVSLGPGLTVGQFRVNANSVGAVSAYFTDGPNSSVQIKHASGALVAVHALAGHTLTLGSNNVPDHITIDTAGGIKLSALAGTGSTLVAVGSTGILSRATVNTDFPSPLAYYWVGRSTNAPTNATNLGGLTTGLLKIAVSAGVATPSTAASGTDYELPLTFASGLTRASNTITGDYITGKAGNQTWVGSTDAGGALLIRSTTNAAFGLLTLTGSSVVVTGAVGTSSLNVQAGALRVAKTQYSYPTAFGDALAANVGAYPNQVEIGNTSGASSLRIGQDSTHTVGMTWSYNATVLSAVGIIDTQGYLNELNIDASKLRLQRLSGFGVEVGSLTGGGLVKSAATTGLLANAVAGTDYQAAISLSAGSVVFSGGTSVLSQDNASFYYDGTNHRLVLANGTTFTPASGAPLTISGAGSGGGTAIALTASGTQALSKTNGTFVINTTTTDDLLIGVGSTTKLSILGAGGVRFAKYGSSTPHVFGDLLGASALGFSEQIEVGSTSGSSVVLVGQGASNAMQFAWDYNATAASAAARIITAGYSNALSLDASTLKLQRTNVGGTVEIGGDVTLPRAAAQSINKSGGSLVIGTTDGNSVIVKTSNTTWATWSNAGLLTLSNNVLQDASGTSSITKSNGTLVIQTNGSNDLLLGVATVTKLSLLSTGQVKVAKSGSTIPTAFGDATGFNAGASQQVDIGSNNGLSLLLIGQDATHAMGLIWDYNATPASAACRIITLGYSNQLAFDGSVVAIQKQSAGAINLGGLVNMDSRMKWASTVATVAVGELSMSTATGRPTWRTSDGEQQTSAKSEIQTLQWYVDTTFSSGTSTSSYWIRPSDGSLSNSACPLPWIYDSPRMRIWIMPVTNTTSYTWFVNVYDGATLLASFTVASGSTTTQQAVTTTAVTSGGAISVSLTTFSNFNLGGAIKLGICLQGCTT